MKKSLIFCLLLGVLMISGSSEAAPSRTRTIDKDHLYNVKNRHYNQNSRRNTLPFRIRIDRDRRHNMYYYQDQQLYRPNYRTNYYNREAGYITSSYIVDTDGTNVGFIIKLANGMFFHIRSNHDFDDGTTVDVFKNQEDSTNRHGEYYIKIYGVMYNANRVQ